MFADKLKKSLLQAAIQGQLTEQLPTDGDARDLLKKIRAEKSKLLATKKIKPEKPLPPVTDDEIPFELPANWCWCRLGDIALKIHYGFTASANSTGNVKLLRITDIQDDKVKWKKVPRCEVTERQKKEYLLRDGDIVIARTGGTVGKSFLVENLSEDAVFASYLIRLLFDENIFSRYVKIFSGSPLYWKQIIDKSQGTGQPNVNGKSLSNLIIPLPPLAEQFRIVERLDALLSEVTELEKDERELNLHVKNFPRKMKNSLLQAAIQGQLTEQLPTDGDARDLLKKIRAEKTKLLAAKKIKAEKPLPPVTDDEIPFELPANWCWCRLGEICNYGTNETIQPSAMQVGKLLIELEDVEKDSGKLINRKTFDGRNANSSKNIFRRGNVLFGKLRVYLNKVIIADADGYCSSEILPLDFGKNILNRYAQIVLMSPPFLSYANACSYGTKMPRLGTKAGQLALFPLPPLAEQLRIVERLNELLPLCEI